jgi:hypothetical protein
MSNDIMNSQHMNVFLNTLMTFNVHHSTDQIREHIKILRVAAEVFEDSLATFIPKILTNLSKQILNDKNAKLQVVISDTIGLLVLNTIENLDESQRFKAFVSPFLKFAFKLLDNHLSNKIVNNAAILCLTKMMLNCPDEVLVRALDVIIDKIVYLLKFKIYPCKQ